MCHNVIIVLKIIAQGYIMLFVGFASTKVGGKVTSVCKIMHDEIKF